MPATEVKAEIEAREPLGLPPAQTPEKTQDARSAAGEDSCCAAPAGRKGRWRPWLIGGAVLLPIALYSGWDWLAATGLATILIAILPCAAMCALGLCMGRGKSRGEMSLAEIRKTYEADSTQPPGRG